LTESAGRGGVRRLIPVTIVTGFLGSGKTTLISRLLRDPSMARTAVIVNEFGEIALDHELIANGDDSVLTLTTGCLCCAMQTDLAATLMSLFERRAEYDRVLIETSGLADPAAMLQAVISDPAVSHTHQVPAVMTVVDAINAEAALDEFDQAVTQVALADTILISKGDLQAPSDRLLDRLNDINPGARRAVTADLSAASLFGSGSMASVIGGLHAAARRNSHSGIETFTVTRERPLPALALTLLLQAIAEHCGSRMLRLKGLVAIAEMPGRPAVIHAVRHVMSAPDFLDCWPGADTSTRIVFIARGIPLFFVSRLLDAIEHEVLSAHPH
jgi:G3E family GTPase